MALQNKYSQLINSAKAEGVQNLEVREQNGVLYIDGTAPSTAVKDKLWQVYNTIDPDYKAGDLVLNIEATDSRGGAEQQEYEVVSGDTLTGIGKKLGKNWKEIFEANRDKIKDPDMIQTGWKLKIPA
ncbi:MAG: LysM peptidoglycan-binding domain-containing protein [Chitinophagaceae bacterium]|jgi:nucleoid-associated protein YgaU|nr:LysM peptidoglycan-binding domain-containing protein [Chitinophagaceae bacterium]